MLFERDHIFKKIKISYMWRNKEDKKVKGCDTSDMIRLCATRVLSEISNYWSG